MAGDTSFWASCGVRASKGTRGSDDDEVPEISSSSRSLYPVMGVVCHPEKTEQLEGFGLSQAGIVSTMSRPVRAGGPSRRTKFPGASCGEQLKSHSSVPAKQGRTSHCFVSLEMMYIHTE